MTNQNDPANPELEQELDNTILDWNSRQLTSIHRNYNYERLIPLITQREAQAYDQGYERGRRDGGIEELERAWGYTQGVSADHIATRLVELEKGKPSNGNLRSLGKGGKPDGE